MGKIHLDTDVLIELIEKTPIEKILATALDHELKISPIVFFEFMVGAYRTNRHDLKSLLLKHLVLTSLTPEIADKAASIEAELMNKGTPLDPRDIIIAAAAIVDNASLWTRNTKHYNRLTEYGLKLWKENFLQKQPPESISQP
ncbi:MAG: type II toxin-antitoxin system VapC family toxin [Candidatus Jordarchaeaceae archaeon]